MKKNLLFVLLIASMSLSAQTTHVISWFMGVSSAQASKTVNAGDTVKWTWDDSAPHTVTSIAGGAETFNSGQLTGSNQEYSRVFNVVGATNYRCSIHAMMQGTITTQQVMGTGELIAPDFVFSPNPVTDILTINSKSVIDRIEVYDQNGRLIVNTTAGNATVKLYMDNYSAGTYHVKAYAGNATKEMTVVKK
ncbi:T9SS type A sorting domain-containing protein [Flavobacterium sp. MFBS3-15]|uniref:T9SS type A sorting domain-containing protein n=1 Tax=Flavobacterium sp. MFBS3-15 TaxID=2989816 RepID=UPI0022364F1F|nr:T9SS type A sorting domain-containing protein [Flavobacterium sp. MFBS3-15]MCW4470875.1 T9SS type A sorting domain-containing protein [Flavobacterium sp. MFBS3-15]